MAVKTLPTTSMWAANVKNSRLRRCLDPARLASWPVMVKWRSRIAATTQRPNFGAFLVDFSFHAVRWQGNQMMAIVQWYRPKSCTTSTHRYHGRNLFPLYLVAFLTRDPLFHLFPVAIFEAATPYGGSLDDSSDLVRSHFRREAIQSAKVS